MEQKAVGVGRCFTALSLKQDASSEFRVMRSDRSGEDTVLNSLHCDLVITGHPGPHGLPESWSPERFLMASGAPVLIIAAGWKSKTIGSKVLVAWNDSPEARRALADAMPFLSSAQRVTVLVVDPARNVRKHGEEPRRRDRALSCPPRCAHRSRTSDVVGIADRRSHSLRRHRPRHESDRHRRLQPCAVGRDHLRRHCPDPADANAGSGPGVAVRTCRTPQEATRHQAACLSRACPTSLRPSALPAAAAGFRAGRVVAARWNSRSRPARRANRSRRVLPRQPGTPHAAALAAATIALGGALRSGRPP